MPNKKCNIIIGVNNAIQQANCSPIQKHTSRYFLIKFFINENRCYHNLYTQEPTQ